MCWKYFLFLRDSGLVYFCCGSILLWLRSCEVLLLLLLLLLRALFLF